MQIRTLCRSVVWVILAIIVLSGFASEAKSSVGRVYAGTNGRGIVYGDPQI